MVDIDAWVRAYERAWKSRDARAIDALFAEDAVYLTAPGADPISGKSAIVEWWLAEEEPGEPEFSWWPVVVTEDTAVVQGRTAYPDATTYLNLWIISFDATGQATSFTEWWMVEE